MPGTCVFENFASAFPSPGISRRRLLDWMKQGRFPTGTRPAGSKSDVHWTREAVIGWFVEAYTECFPESVERVKAALEVSGTAPTTPIECGTAKKRGPRRD